MQPKVSIIMGIYNCEDTIEESIESILKQSHENIELIMCDDGSKDRTYEIAKRYAIEYEDKIILLKNEENLTLGPTLNRCIEKATGKYIARQDADDKSKEDRIQKQVDFMEKNPDIDLVGTEMYVIENGEMQGIRKVRQYPRGIDMIKGSVFAHATIMLKKEIYLELGGYSLAKNKRGVEDYDLWFKFFKKQFRGVNMQEPLYYVTENSEAYKRKDVRRRIRECQTLMNGIKDLRLGKVNYIYCIKPVATILIPKTLLKMYHKLRIK